MDGTIDSQFAEPDAGGLSVGASDGGDAVAAWRDAGGGVSAVKLLLWRAGVAQPEVTVPGLGTTPSVAMAPDGRAVAAWTGSDGKPRVARRAPGGSFAAPAVIEDPVYAGYPGVWGAATIAMRADGSAVMAVPACADFGASADLSSRAFDVSPAGVITGPFATQAGVTGMGCSGIGSTRVAVGAGGQTAITTCASSYCQLSTRAVDGAIWTPSGVDGSFYAPSTSGAVPIVTPAGSTVVTWSLNSPAPARVRAAIGPMANTLTQLGNGSDPSVASTAPDLTPFGTDALAVWQTATAGGQSIIARPIFANGTYGAASTIVPLTAQAAPPYADPHVASWPDGTSVIAYANQPSPGGTPTLALQRRTIGGILSPIATTALPARDATLPRVALAGNSPAPLGIVATREAPASPAKATIVVRRIDGVAPLLSIDSAPAAVAGTPARFVASVSDVSAPITVAWDFGDGAVAQGTDVQHAFATAGARTVTATATDAAGNVRSAAVTINVSAVAPAGPAPDTTPPVITGAKPTPKAFRVGTAITALAASAAPRRAPKGTALKLTLSERATLQLLVVRTQRGRRVKGKCTVGAKKGARCTRRTTKATLTRALPAGAASIPFSGRLKAGRLPVGTYEFALVATDSAGNRSKPVTVAFSIVR